ncbi:acyltransferase family protein [Poriferisphaera corsica]|uniref:acyltransferase family protein n=1 Tax=Poriferisphaera corsica TaxID=2528020 RepID=UPI0011A3B9BA|nr:acyltransferase [Poriferisphaera corsica]
MPTATATSTTLAPPPLTPHQQFLTRRHFTSLDGLRCFAILTVLWHHAFRPEFLNAQLLTRGFLGVDLFFILSGFLITTLLIRERAIHQSISLRAFYARRSLRIFPIYYLSLIALTLLFALGFSSPHHQTTFFQQLPLYLTYTSNWSDTHALNLAPLWSLATEEQFYLFWPLVERFAKPTIRFLFYAFALCLSQAINFQLIYPFFSPDLAAHLQSLEIMQSTFTPILLGVGLAYLLHHKPTFNKLYKPLAHIAALPCLVLTLILLIHFTPANILGLPRLLIQLNFSLILAAIILNPKHFAHTLLNLKPITHIGLISYGMYLYHMWVLALQRQLLTPHISPENQAYFDFLLGTLLTIIAATLSFKLIESPLLKLKKHFTRIPPPK